ncbi:MAG: aldehyde dehydrogenase (NADP(+)) [Desulfuromonadales bacterium]|nr:aldehyde dehydrogenase (NADP(+)) [Desulfuromonadales bacterium]
MKLTGQQIIAGNHRVEVSAKSGFRARNPVTSKWLQPLFSEGVATDVASAVVAAERDFDLYRQLPFAKRAEFLTAIADELLASGQELIARAELETGLPRARLEGELGRTVNQLKLFAQFVQQGEFLQLRVTHALPDRQPLARPDIRMTQIPLGPVAVFGASNFPLAFSVAGGDTASALAAGCPVVVKGHPAHPGTSELAGRAISQAVMKSALPAGVFSLLQGSRDELGAALVRHPLIKAVAFTGSLAGGRALFDLAVARPEPIPVFAEMGSVNPVFLLPGALASGGGALAEHYADSVVLGVGQFCTKPGLLLAVQGSMLDVFVQRVEARLLAKQPEPMLHRGIKQNYLHGVHKVAVSTGVETVVDLKQHEPENCLASPALFRTTGGTFLANPELAEEVFGPSAIVVVCSSFEQMLQVAGELRGQLSATVHAIPEEENDCRQLFNLLERKAGRLILNGFPTGVEVCSAMVHGGPYPATTDSRSTSVGSSALYRFLRPLCYQGFTPGLLPEELRGL